MKNLLTKLFFGKDARFNGLAAFAIVGAIALGCTCNKNFGDLAKNDSPSNTSSSNSTSTNQPDRRSTETKPDASKGTLPPDDQLQYLVRETMLDFNEAIDKADFTEFHSSVCKPWQKQITPDGMKGLFQKFIDGRASFGEISDMTANFTTKTTRKEGGYKLLEVNGSYPTSPNATTFELNYIAEGSDWKLSKIQVVTTIYNKL